MSAATSFFDCFFHFFTIFSGDRASFYSTFWPESLADLAPEYVIDK